MYRSRENNFIAFLNSCTEDAILGDFPHEFDNRGVDDDLFNILHVEVLVAGVVMKVVRQLLTVDCQLDILAVLIESLLEAAESGAGAATELGRVEVHVPLPLNLLKLTERFSVTNS